MRKSKHNGFRAFFEKALFTTIGRMIFHPILPAVNPLGWILAGAIFLAILTVVVIVERASGPTDLLRP